MTATDPAPGDPASLPSSPASLPLLPSLPASLPPLPTLGAVSRRPPPGGARREWQDAVLVSAGWQTPRARTLLLELPPGTPAHVPGQHYVVRVARDDGSWAQRSYSVASAPERPVPTAPAQAGPALSGPQAGRGRRLELAVERLDDGELSPYLHEVSVGSTLQVRGPFGGWFIWRGDTPALLVGGGSGVVPLMSMQRWWRATGGRQPLRLVVSVRTPGDLWYREELGAETTVVYTRSAGQDSAGQAAAWQDARGRPPGRLDAGVLSAVLIPGATCYVCGSAGFAEHASRLLVELGVPATDVRVERFGPS